MIHNSWQISELTALKDNVKISLASITDAAADNAIVKEAWTLDMKAGQRYFSLDIQGEVQKEAQVTAIRHR